MNDPAYSRIFTRKRRKDPSSIKLDHGSRVAVIGGGPSGSFFSYFLLDMAERVDLKIHVDIYEPRDFTKTAPAGCNMCGGVIYESLVQSLAVEGINLPPHVVQRGIEYNMLHMDIGSTQIHTPRQEKRIATTFRGAGPRDFTGDKGGSLDGYLMQVAVEKGARHIQDRVTKAKWLPDPSPKDPAHKLMQIKTRKTAYQTYEFVAVTSGVNTSVLKQFGDLDIGYLPPQTTKLSVREYQLGQETVSRYIGPVFHGFLLDIPGLDYGAIIPKGKYITICLLSSKGDLDAGVMETFLNDPAVKKTLPPDFNSDGHSCRCGPRINVLGSKQPFGDRIVFIGDSGVSRLYKDGIGAAYRTAKVAANTAVFQGISAKDFQGHYLPFCRKMNTDNRIGKFIFRVISQIQKMEFARRAVLRMVTLEQQGKSNAQQGMSMVMWDMLTGGAPYKEVLTLALHPAFLIRLLWNITISLFSTKEYSQSDEAPLENRSQNQQSKPKMEVDGMSLGALGKVYQNGEIIVRQGDSGDCMYVVQDGLVEVIFEADNQEVQLNVLEKNEFFGEMALFNEELRTATVRALGTARILTVDHKNLLRCIHEDPSLAYRLMEEMSSRIDRLSEAVAQLSESQSE